MMPEVTYQYWTYNGKVPGPFIRARAGDQVEIHLSYGKPGTAHQGTMYIPRRNMPLPDILHIPSIYMLFLAWRRRVLNASGARREKSFRFKAMHPGIYVYHCASPHVPSHIANGMYGMILVEPAEGLAKVDREFYVMQGDFYTTGNMALKVFKRSARKSCWRNSRIIFYLMAGSTR